MKDEKKKVALLSNITVDLIAAKLRGQYDLYLPEGFDTWIQDAISPESGLYSSNPDAIVVLLDGTEARAWKCLKEGEERIALWKQAILELSNRIGSVPIFVSTIDFRENRIKAFSERKHKYEMQNDWYQFIQSLAESKGNVYTLDIADVIAETGRKNFYSNKMWYMSSMPYSREGITVVCSAILRALKAAFETRKKIIVLDLDNTLWGGVIGEDGLEGIELSDHKEGERYFDFQRQLLEMKNRGVVLALNSKNNEEDVVEVLREHPSMLLHEDDFVNRKINWENKAINIKAMEQELNLTEGGFVFVDDNPVERETVKGECPEVTVPVFPADTTELINYAEEIWFDYFQQLRVLEEDLKKTQMYKSDMKRKLEMSGSINLDDYLTKLEMIADIHKMRPSEIERVTQLINKTNQFNLTTKRYTRADIEEMSSEDGIEVYVVYCSDKYGDSGLVSVIILKNVEEDLLVDTFLMSCRVMGRKLEEVIVNELAAAYSDKRKMIGEYISTAKNVPVAKLYDRLGFRLESEKNGHKLYSLTLSNYVSKGNGCYREVSFTK